MSTLRTTTLSNAAGSASVPVDTVISGSAKAWVSFNGTGSTSTNQTIRAQANVSSVFKNGTGDYTVNFTTALSDANYVATAIGPQIANGGGAYQIAQNTATAPTPSAFRLNVQSAGGSMHDSASVNLAFFR
jgi:hypothetical protein